MTLQEKEQRGGLESRGNIPVTSEDDEENEEIMRANGKLVTGTHTSDRDMNSNNNRDSVNSHNTNGSKPKSAADNWKGIGNRHMASLVSLFKMDLQIKLKHGIKQ